MSTNKIDPTSHSEAENPFRGNMTVISVSTEKVMAPIPIPKFNPGFGSQY